MEPLEKQSLPTAGTDVKTIGAAKKMRSLLNSDVNLALPRYLPADSGLHSRLRRWSSSRLYAAHCWYCAHIEFKARRASALLTCTSRRLDSGGWPGSCGGW